MSHIIFEEYFLSSFGGLFKRGVYIKIMLVCNIATCFLLVLNFIKYLGKSYTRSVREQGAEERNGVMRVGET
jgi:hypothetical protein